MPGAADFASKSGNSCPRIPSDSNLLCQADRHIRLEMTDDRHSVQIELTDRI